MDHEPLRMVWTQTWQVSLLILAVAGLARLCGRNHPHFAHALWVVVLVKAVTPPLWTSSAGVFSRLQTPPEPREVESPEIPPEIEAFEEPVEPPIVASRFDPALFANAPVIPADEKPALPPPMPEAEVIHVADVSKLEANAAELSLEPSETATTQPIWSRVLLMVWAVGAVGSLVLAWVRWLLCKRAIRRADEVHDPELQELLQQLARRIGLRRKVRLIISKSRIGPAVWGVFRPVVLIPYQVIRGKRPADLEPILAHELIHIRRGDLWVGWFGVLVQAVWWFHPLVWWAGRLIKREAERCCDEEVVAELGMKPARYARALLDVLEQKQTLKTVPVLPGVKPVEVTSKRLERIMLLRHGCRKRTPRWCYLVMLLTAAVTLPGAAFVAQAKDKEDRTETKSEESSKLITRHYKVGELVDEIKSEHRLDDDATARTHLLARLRAAADALWQEDRILFNAKEAGTPSLSIKGNRLTVRHSAKIQEEIAEQLAWLKEHGFGEVVIEARVLTAKRDLLKDLAIDWKDVSPKLTQADQTGWIKSSIIGDAESKKIVDIVQQHPRTNLMMCPKVRVFNGRTATIEDVTKHAIVVPQGKDERSIEFISEGLTLKLHPIMEDSQIRLASEITLSDVKGSNGVIYFHDKKGKATRPSEFQVPAIATMRVNTEFKVPDGGTVLLGGMTPINQAEGDEDEGLYILIRVASIDQKADRVSETKSGRFHLGTGAGHDAKDTQKAELLYFEADWCGPCRQMTPIVSRFKRQGHPVQSVDVDKQRDLAQRFDVKSLPTFLLVVDGKERERLVGVTSESQLRRLLAQIPTDSNPPVESPPSKPTPHSTLPYQGGPLTGTGVNSDAGVTGSIVIDEKNFIVIDEKNFDLKNLEPPTDEEVLKMLDKQSEANNKGPLEAKVERKNVRIVKERLPFYIESPRMYPHVGLANLVKAQFKCTVHYDKIVSSSWPVSFQQTDHVSEVVYIDHSHLVRADSWKPEPPPVPPKTLPPKDVQPAAYLKADVQYFPEPKVHGGVTKSDAKKDAELAKMVEEFNSLFEKKRYQEAEKLARKAKELFPESPAAEVMFWKSRYVLREMQSETLKEEARAREIRSEKEEKIEDTLKRTTTLKFKDTPLSDVAKHVATQHGIDIVLDNLGLSEEGVTADQTVSINVEYVKLSSALNLLLKPLRLNYHIEDEVLKITSQTRIDLKSVTVRTYPVADLVVPLPRMSTVDLRAKPVLAKPESGETERLVPPPAKVDSKEKAWDFEGRIPPKADEKTPIDFDDLTKLITSSIEPDSWAEAGGIGSIASHETTLSLVIRQTDRVHEQVAEVLEQLRKLQDVQVSLGIHSIEISDVDQAKSAKSLKAGKPVTLNRDEVSELVKNAAKGGTLPNITSLPKMTIFNGQTVSVILPAADEDGMKLELSPVSTADRRFVRLQLALSSDPAEGQDHLSQHHLKDGHSLLVDVTKYHGDKSGKRRLLLITPTIIVQEEEEELLGLPSAKGKSPRVDTVAPRIIVQEEEEELLRIPAEK